MKPGFFPANLSDTKALGDLHHLLVRRPANIFLLVRRPANIFLLIRVAAAAAKSPQSCPTLCDPIEGSPLGSSVPGILQARILEWVAISFSNA